MSKTKQQLLAEIAELQKKIADLEKQNAKNVAPISTNKTDLPTQFDQNSARISNLEIVEETRRRYEFIVNTSREFQTLINPDFIYEAVNESYCQAHDKRRDEIVGKSVAEIWGPETYTEIKPFLEKCFSGSEFRYQHTFKFAALGMRTFEVAYYPYFNSTGKVTHAVVVSRDVTDRKAVEAERKLLAAALEQSAEIVIITDSEGNIQYANSAFEKVSGYSVKEIIHKNPSILKSGVHDADFYADLWDTLLRGEVWRGRFTNKARDGRLFEEDASISPIRDETGKIAHFVAVKRDVTREVYLEKQLNQAHKMEAIGTLAGGIAHDFNNILAAIIGFADLFRLQLSESGEPPDEINEILKAAMRGKELVKQILTFSREIERKRIPIKLHTVIAEAVKLLKATLPSTIDIQMDIDPSAYSVLADPTQIQRVVVNLCTNGIHAMPDQKGTLVIRLKSVVVFDKTVQYSPTFAKGIYQCLTIIDSGVGMDKTTMERIFEPYFTTKNIGHGTGLGLSVVHGIIKEHEGIIKVESEPGKGSTFNIYFPCSPIPAHENVGDQKQIPSGKGRVLFIDDEKPLVQFGIKALTRLGYTVTGFSDPIEALNAFTSRSIDFDILITDSTMPGMSGLELVERIRKINSRIPIILCSGFNSDVFSRTRAKELGIRRFLRKPFTVAALGQTIMETLEIDTVNKI